MTSRRIRTIGIDPGPVPGFVELRYLDRVLVHTVVVQCTANTAAPVFLALLAELSPRSWKSVVQIEKFVITPKSGRLATAGASSVTRDLVGALQHEAQQLKVPVVQRAAGQVKPWATDRRLEIAGLLDLTKGMRHARDAARHALFAAVRDTDLPDPLSKEFKAP